MKSTWTMPDYVAALRDRLKARPSLSDVQIWAAPIGKDLLQKEAIAIIDVDTDQENAALGKNRQSEVYIVEGAIQVLKIGQGDDVAEVARNRAAAIMAEIELEVMENPALGLNATSQVIRHSYVSLKNLRQGIQDQHRRAVVEFNITVSTKIGT